jgi:CheY-like chemotaxis protein
VLVVDDESIVRSVIRLMLERAGFAVQEADSAANALERLQASPFTVVLLDYTLPDRSGTDLIPELRRAAPGVRVILTSGRPESDLTPHRADGYLGKPFAREQLVAAVEKVLALS